MNDSDEKHEELMTKLIGKQKHERLFRLLKASEIDCRISTVKENGFSVLLYKDARCDMNILDETVGAMNWERRHSRDNANCIVSIYDERGNRWVSKEDTGTESFTEKEKGIASDSFKRACFNWGIGRELYTAPFIWINSEKGEVFKKGEKYSSYAKMRLQTINYKESGEIESIIIIDSKGNVRFGYGTKRTSPIEPKEIKTDYKSLYKNASNLEELKMLWDGLSRTEKDNTEELKETRKKEILNFKNP